jgi:hypothetical protein
MTTTASKIESFFRLSLNNKNIFVADANPRHEGEYDYAIFLNERNYKDYVSNKMDTEDLIIWQLDGGRFGFSYLVEDPGVYMHKDGSGTPPSWELVEHKETFTNILDCTKKISEFIFQGLVNQAVINYNENYD